VKKKQKNNTVSIRRRFIGDEGELSIDKLINDVSLEIKKRSLPYRKS
jgi:threonyl-tRNA synthetase